MSSPRSTASRDSGTRDLGACEGSDLRLRQAPRAALSSLVRRRRVPKHSREAMLLVESARASGENKQATFSRFLEYYNRGQGYLP